MTRPINEWLGKMDKREEEIRGEGREPEVVIVGAGAAGVELACAFRERWGRVFGQ